LRILCLHEQRVVAVEVLERDAAHLSVRLRHAGEQRAAARELRKQRVEVRTVGGSNRGVNRDRFGFVVGRASWGCRDVDVVGELGELFEGDRSSGHDGLPFRTGRTGGEARAGTRPLSLPWGGYRVSRWNTRRIASSAAPPNVGARVRGRGADRGAG